MEKRMIDNLNAEISLGTVTTIDEGVQWLGYTYLYIRMRREPHIYGIDRKSLGDDPFLGEKRRELITAAAKKLHDLQMIVFDPRTGNLMSKDLGRIASYFYIYYRSIEMINKLMTSSMEINQVLHMISECSEFSNIKSRGQTPESSTNTQRVKFPCLKSILRDFPMKSSVEQQPLQAKSIF
jgi:antiviral helicase SLH1